LISDFSKHWNQRHKKITITRHWSIGAE
jgi:hypothetical protein